MKRLPLAPQPGLFGEPPTTRSDSSSSSGSKGRARCETCAGLLGLLNELAGKNFTGSGLGLGRLHARHTERGEAACEKVIRVMVLKWLGTKMEDYLRPETLFRPTKFDGYLNAAPAEPPRTTRKLDPHNPADADERARLRAEADRISPERRAAGVAFLKHQIAEVNGKLDRLMVGPRTDEEAAETDTLAKRLEDLRRDLAFLEAGRGIGDAR